MITTVAIGAESRTPGRKSYTEPNRPIQTCSAASSAEVPCPDCRSECKARLRRERVAQEAGVRE